MENPMIIIPWKIQAIKLPTYTWFPILLAVKQRILNPKTGRNKSQSRNIYVNKICVNKS